MARSEYGKSFQDHHKSKRPERQERRQTARAAFDKTKGKQGIASYDSGAAGGRRFGMKDVDYLKGQGFTNKEIVAHTKTLGRKDLGENIRLNHQKFAGNHYEGGGTYENISDHDVGGGFNMANVRHLQSKGFSDEEIAKHANQMVLEGGKRHGNAMSKFMEEQGQLNYYHGDWAKAKEKAQAHQANSDTDENNNTTVDGETKPGKGNQQIGAPGNSGSAESTTNMEQNVNQDNDITTSIDGNNNYVSNQQDNSIRQYGGSSKTFNYTGSGKMTDNPASMATLGGFYDVDDSPAAQAKFTDLHQTLNSDRQKRYGETSSIAEGATRRAARNSTINTNALDKRAFDRQQYSFAKADMMGMNLFGDMYKNGAPDWTSPERQSEVEKPDFEKMYDKYTDF